MNKKINAFFGYERGIGKEVVDLVNTVISKEDQNMPKESLLMIRDAARTMMDMADILMFYTENGSIKPFTDEQMRLLIKYDKEDPRQLCSKCLESEGYPHLAKCYIDMFDTGTCDGCKSTNDVLYVPFGRLYTEHGGISPYVVWRTLNSRKREDILMSRL